MQTIRNVFAVMLRREHSGMVQFYEDLCVSVAGKSLISTGLSGPASLLEAFAEEAVFHEVLVSGTVARPK